MFADSGWRVGGCRRLFVVWAIRLFLSLGIEKMLLRGDGFFHRIGLWVLDCECWIASATHPALRAPLSERGRRSSGLDVKFFNTAIGIVMYCVAVPSRRGVPEGRGVSHSQTQAANRQQPQVANRQVLCVAPSEFFSHYQNLNKCLAEFFLSENFKSIWFRGNSKNVENFFFFFLRIGLFVVFL